MSSVRIHASKIIGTKITVYSAWEPYAGHSTFMHFDGVPYGRIGTCSIPSKLDTLPALSDERYTAVKTWHRAEYQRAYEAIIAEYPNTVSGEMDMGEITVKDNPFFKDDESDEVKSYGRNL